MPRLVIKLSGTEYDMLTEYAASLRRTPSAQAEQIVADAVAELLRLAAQHRNGETEVVTGDRTVEPQSHPAPVPDPGGNGLPAVPQPAGD